jgi:hypothetical protein
VAKRRRRKAGLKLLTTKEAARRAEALGLAPGKRFRGWGFDPKDQKQFISGPRAAFDPRGLRSFEREVDQFLADCAKARATKRPLPDIPPIIKNRYEGRALREWCDKIFKSERYERIKLSVVGNLSRAKLGK